MLPIVVDLDGGIGSQQEEQRPGGGIGSFVKATCYLLNTNPLQHCSLGVLSICVFVFLKLNNSIFKTNPLLQFAYLLLPDLKILCTGLCNIPYMCAIPACEEFITEFCEFPFLSPNSVHASSPFSVNHIFFSLNSVTFLTLIFLFL